VASFTVPEMLPVVWALAAAQQKIIAAAVSNRVALPKRRFIKERLTACENKPDQHHAAKGRSQQLNRGKTSSVRI